MWLGHVENRIRLIEDDDAGDEIGTERDEDDGNNEEGRGRNWDSTPSFFHHFYLQLSFLTAPGSCFVIPLIFLCSLPACTTSSHIA